MSFIPKEAQKQQEDRFDCMITAGQLDHNRYGHFLDNDLKVCEVVKRNVTLKEAKAWIDSLECWRRTRELEEFGRKKFGKDYWMEWRVCRFFTTASKDEKEGQP